MKWAPIIIIIAVLAAMAFFAVSSNLPPAGEKIIEPAKLMGTLKLTSPAFENNSALPDGYTCDNGDLSPALSISGAPNEAISLALVLKDPDAYGGDWIHWIKFNMPTIDNEVGEGEDPGGVSGKTTGGIVGYESPCPPAGAPHHYIFTLYALDVSLKLSEGAEEKDVSAAMAGHIIDKAELVGTYQKR